MMKRKLGKVMVSGDLIQMDTEIIAKLLSKMGAIILRCEHFFDRDVFEYIMYSPLFDEIDLNCNIPPYEIGVTNHYEDGKIIDFDVDVRKLPGGWIQATHPTTLELMIEKMHKQDNNLKPAE
jgi:hypothetical protein